MSSKNSQSQKSKSTSRAGKSRKISNKPSAPKQMRRPALLESGPASSRTAQRMSGSAPSSASSKGRPITPPLPRKKEEEEIVLPHVEPVVTSVKGMRDIVPMEQAVWQRVRGVTERLAQAFGYLRIDTPIVEKTELFERGVGKITDIVEKEMFTFVDQGRNSLSLRPEGTAGVARAFVERGLHTMPQPLKVYHTGSRFRRERPQAGRYREFFQFDLDVLGSDQPAVDAEIMFISHKMLTRLGLTDLTFQVNSIGCSICRPAYVETLASYYASKRRHLSENDRKRMKRSPLRLLDSKEEGAKELAVDAPHFVDYLCEACNRHFTSLLEFLDESGVPYALNPRIVRGLDYYTRSVFELVMGDPDTAGTEATLGSGGRYDGLVKLMGGHDTPAVGIGLGLDRIVEAVAKRAKAAGAEGEDSFYRSRNVDVFLAQLGDLAKKRALPLADKLVDAGFSTAFSLSRDSLKSQLRLADKYGARITLIFGQKEALEGSILIRDMQSGVQELIATDRIVTDVRRRLSVPAITRSVVKSVVEEQEADQAPLA